MAIVNNLKDSTSLYLPSPGERLRWARQTLRKMSHQDLSRLTDLPLARLRRLEHPRSLLSDTHLGEMVLIALALDVFVPWLVDGIGHPTRSGFNQDIEWIRACETNWQAPGSAPKIHGLRLEAVGGHFDLKTTQMMSEALAPLVARGNGLLARPSERVLPEQWAMFSVDGPGMVGQTNVRFLRYAPEQEQPVPRAYLSGLDDADIRVDLLPVNPLHFAYRLPRYYLSQCDAVLGQWEPRMQPTQGNSGFAEFKDFG